MNIIPPNYNPNASLVNYAHPILQNDATLHLSKQSNNSKSVSASSSSSKGDDEKKHIRDLSKRLPGLTNIFNLHHKIGEGSFSSVFLASLKYHDHLPREQRKLFAIKHLVPTSHPSRIEQELRCLKYIGGCDNVVGLDFCMRKYDTVIFVMPYLPHNKFSEYVLKMDVQETKLYVKNLLLALRRVHQFNIIHRDVKPSNFLYDRVNKRFLLVDFGLAQKMDNWPTNSVGKDDNYVSNSNPSLGLPNNLPLVPSIESTQQNHSANGKKRKYDDLNDEQATISELEPFPKRHPGQLEQPAQSNIGGDCAPLKPLQDDHPKIIPTVDVVPPVQRSLTVAPKLATVKRQVLVDDENRTKLETNPLNKRLENVFNNSPINVQSYSTNNISNHYNSYSNSHINNFYCNSLQNPYHIANFPVGRNPRDLHELAQYYNNYYSYNNMLINNILMSDKNNLHHYKSNIEYQFYKNQLMQNSLNNYSNLYAVNSKLGLLNGVAGRAHKTIPESNTSTRVGKSDLNNIQLERGDISKQVSVKHEALKKEGSPKTGSTMKLCGCGGKPAVCSVCLGRGAYNAPRAGTQGFRPPEVLLKYTEQTTAVDLWACGVILLSIVSGCYPFFRAPDDLTALAEMVTLFGTKPLKEVAIILGRHLMCSHMKKPLDLRKLCSHLRYRALKTNSAGSSDLVKSTIDYLQDVGCQNNTLHKTDYKHSNITSSILQNQCQKINTNVLPTNAKSALFKNSLYNNLNAATRNVNKNNRKYKKNCEGCSLPAESCVCASEESHKNSCTDKANRTWCGFPDDAFDLLERLLDLNPHTRITAMEALQHPFLADL